MATTLMGVLEARHAEAGPNPLYAQSWARAISLLRPAWRAEETNGFPVQGSLADGGGALALALYLIAAAEDIAPETVTRAQIEELQLRDARFEFTRSRDTMSEWESRLRALGHDIDDAASNDPVVMHWRDLSKENGPAEDAPDGVWDDATLRVGPGLVDGLNAVLAPIYANDLNF